MALKPNQSYADTAARLATYELRRALEELEAWDPDTLSDTGRALRDRAIQAARDELERRTAP